MRNSVKVLIDAYSGQMTFYDADPSDPILQAYSAAFPHMFQPLSTMPAQLRAHLRYPEDIFSIQSAIYGRYHLINPQAFYAASNAWQLSPTAGAGPQSQALLAQNTYNSQGQLVSSTPARMAPQYQVYALPGTDSNSQVFTVSDGFVPASQSSLSNSNQNFNLTAWMVGLSDPGTTASSTSTRLPREPTARPTPTPRSQPTHGVEGHLAARPEGIGGSPGRDAHGPGRELNGLPASPLRVAHDQRPAPAAVRHRRPGQEVKIDTSLSTFSGPLQTTVTLPSGGGAHHRDGSLGGGGVPPAAQPTTTTRTPLCRPGTWRCIQTGHRR